MIKYALHPGYVIKENGDREWVCAKCLADKFGIDFKECIVIEPRVFGIKRQTTKVQQNLIDIYPN